MTTIEAIKLIDLNEAVATSGLKLAQIVVEKLQRTDTVTVSLAGVRGIPSSFFNNFISHITDAVGPGAFPDRVKMYFDTKVQRDTFERSLQAVLGRPAKSP